VLATGIGIFLGQLFREPRVGLPRGVVADPRRRRLPLSQVLIQRANLAGIDPGL
jgi:hypothetical protein